MRLRGSIVAALELAAFWLPSLSVALQTPDASPYKSFEVLILPEYEHPGVEISVAGEVKPGQYPRYLEMEVPANTRVALLSKHSQQGAPVSERIAALVQDDRTFLPVDVSEAQFFIRYFFNPFEIEGANRTFSFNLTTNEVLPEFHITIQKPVAALNFRHSLTEADELEGDFGLIYYRQHIPGLQPGNRWSVTVSYDNPTNAFTVPVLQARMEQLQAESSGDHPVGDGQPLNFTTVLLFSALLGAAMFIALKKRGWRKTAAAVDFRETPGITPAKKSTPGASEGEKFCTGCGTPQRPGARYCSNCGKEF